MVKARLFYAALVAVLACVLLDARQIIIRNSNDCDNVPSPCGAVVANPIAAARQPLGNTSTPNSRWAAAGVEGGIPTVSTQCGGTISAYTGTAGTINTAISNCNSGGGGYVLLGSGTFSLTTSIVMKSNVLLKGTGPGTNVTILSFTNEGGGGHFWGAGEIAIVFQGSFNSTGYGTDPGYGGAPAANIKTWTGTGGVSNTYTQGATVLNLGSAPTGLSVNDMLTLWQLNDDNSSVPHSGYLVSAKTGTGTSAISINGGQADAEFSYQQQRVKVTNINGSDVTVTPGVYLPSTGTWRTGQTPKVAWQTSGGNIKNAGLEDLTVRTTGYNSAQYALVVFHLAENCWIRGVAFDPKEGTYAGSGAPGNSDGTQSVVQVKESRNITVSNNWFDKSVGGGFGSSTAYGVMLVLAQDSLIENNIFVEVTSPIIVDTGTNGTVISYNYEAVSGREGGLLLHEGGSNMDLIEGNSIESTMYIAFHGNNNFITVLRNHNWSVDVGVDVWSYGRFWNILGNVFTQSAVYKTLPTDSTKYSRWDNACIRLGYPTQIAGAGPDTGIAQDSEVWTSAFLWGNYCGDNGTVRWLSAEVPTSEPNYPNSVPVAQTVPTSLYRSSRPAFFTLASPISTTVTWPPIGPEVTGGTYGGGRAYKLPAQLVYENVSGVMASFDPNVYGH